MSAVSAAVYDSLLAALQSESVQDRLASSPAATDRKAVLRECLAAALEPHQLPLEAVLDSYDLTLLDAPVDPSTLQQRLHLQIQLQVLKRPLADAHVPDDKEVRRQAYQGRAVQ